MPLDQTSTSSFQEPPFVPQALLNLPQWVCRQADKVPICVSTGTSTGFTRLEMGRPYPEAIAAAQRLGLPGVGFVFQAKNHLIGIDLDKCRDPVTGVIQPWAQAIIDKCETYAEFSPSGRGIHLIATGDLSGKTAVKNTPAQVEMYTSGRYFTVTGDHVPGTPGEVNAAPLTLADLHARLKAFPAGPASTTKPARQAPPVGSADAFSAYAYSKTFFGQINALAMERLGDWVPELFPTAGLEAGTGAWRVKSKDLGRGLEEDISIHPEGIVDFGVHDLGDEREGKRTPIDLVIEWLGGEEEGADKTSAVEAALWLCLKLGVDPKSLGYRGGGVNNGESEDNSPGPDPAPPLPDVVDWETAKAGRVRTIQPTIFSGLDRGLLSVIGGASGTLKSTYLMHVAVAIIAERPDIIGHTKIDYCGDVLVFANEDPEEIIDKRLDAIQARHGITSRKHKLYVQSGQMFEKVGKNGTFAWKAEAWAKIEAVILKTKAAGRQLALVAVDTLASTAAGNDETNREMQEIAGLMDDLVKATFCAGLFVHHWRKSGPSDKSEVDPQQDALRGGGALGNTVRNVVFVSRPNKTDIEDAMWTPDMARDFIKLWIEKRSYGPTTQDEPAWFEKEKVAVPVIDPRDGSLHLEDYLVLLPTSISKAKQRMNVLIAAWKKIEAANAAGRELVQMNKANKSARSVQGYLGLSDEKAGRLIDELVEKKWVALVDGTGSDRKPAKNVVALRIDEDNNI